MIKIPDKLRENVLEAKRKIEEYSEITLVHHDDADGICSAALTMLGIGLNRKMHRICLEKLFPEAIRLIHMRQKSNELIIYVDLGSPHVKTISKNLERGSVLIIDHHEPEEVDDERIVHINPELYGFKGETDASASTMAYATFKLMGKNILEYAFLAIIGSAEIPGRLRGLNEIPLKDSEITGRVRKHTSKTGEKYYVDFYGLRKPHYTISSIITTISSIGYYREGPKYAVKACFEGLTREVMKFYDEMKELKRELFEKALSKIRNEGLRKTSYVQWFNVGKLFYNVGVKTIGLFTSQLRYKSLVDLDKYILGFMEMNPEIPGLGKLPEQLLKVSGRVPLLLEEKIRKGEMPSIADAMVKAAKHVGGFADGHMFASSGIIRKECIERFVNEFDRIVSEKVGKKGILKYFT